MAFTIQGKNATATAVSANVTFGTTTGTSDLSALRDSINNYTTTTGITATLSADKTNIILVQNEGYDIKIGDVDFGNDTATTGARKTLIVTSLDNDEAVAGSSVSLSDKAATTVDDDHIFAAGSAAAAGMTLSGAGATTADDDGLGVSQDGTALSSPFALALAGSSASSTTLNSRITLTSGGNDETKTATVTGKDIYGNDQTEVITLANAGVATGKKVFASVSAINTSAALAGTIKAGIAATIPKLSSLITINGVSDESDKIFTITGLDMNGAEITEKITGPAAGATVTGRLQFSAIFSVATSANSTGNVKIGIKNADSAIVSGQLEFYSSNSFTVLGEEEKSLFESSPGAASLDKLETVNVKTRDSSINALRVIDRSLDRIHRERAKLGALMSRMEKAIDNLTNVAVNTEASRGRIRDANFAKESSTLTKAQILQQSALAMIAQAGRIQQNVLTLLQN